MYRIYCLYMCMDICNDITCNVDTSLSESNRFNQAINSPKTTYKIHALNISILDKCHVVLWIEQSNMGKFKNVIWVIRNLGLNRSDREECDVKCERKLTMPGDITGRHSSYVHNNPWHKHFMCTHKLVTHTESIWKQFKYGTFTYMYLPFRVGVSGFLSIKT